MSEIDNRCDEIVLNVFHTFGEAFVIEFKREMQPYSAKYEYSCRFQDTKNRSGKNVFEPHIDEHEPFATIEIEKDDVKRLLSMPHKINVPLLPQNDTGRDGSLYSVCCVRNNNEIKLSWWCEIEPEFYDIGMLVGQILDLKSKYIRACI